MTIGYHNRNPKDVPYRYYPSLREMAADVDTMVLVVPGGAQTHHLVDTHRTQVELVPAEADM